MFSEYGYCVRLGRIVSPRSGETCENYRVVSVEELKNILKKQGYLYCVTCKQYLFTEEELEDHIKHHTVIAGLVRDEGAPEEIPSAD